MLLALCLAITCKRTTGPMNKHMFSDDVRGNRTLLICLNSINVRSDIRRWHLNNIEAGLDGVQLVFRSNSCQVFYRTTFLGKCPKIPRKHPPWKFFSVNLQPFVLKTFLKLTPSGLSFFNFLKLFWKNYWTMLRQLPPRKIASWIIALWIIGPRTNASKIIDPGQCPPGQLPPKKIGFRIVCYLHNCPSDIWPRGKLLPPPLPGKFSQGWITPEIFFPEKSEIIVL